MASSSAASSAGANTASSRALQQELKGLVKEPVEGFVVQPDERVSAGACIYNIFGCIQHLSCIQDLYKWSVAIFGPPGTLYQGGYFKAQIKFPSNYPFSPPSMRFLTKVWHPNVYEVQSPIP